MKKIVLLLICALSGLIASAKSEDVNSKYYGVWANDSCELVLTPKYTLFFRNYPDSVVTMLRRNDVEGKKVTSQFVKGYGFLKSGKSYWESAIPDAGVKLDKMLKLKDGKLYFTLNDQKDTLGLVEKITPTFPYQMTTADTTNVGRCLQEWQLGTKVYGLDKDYFHIEIGTNQHSYMLYSTPEMVYWRAARERHSNLGTVFAQNIRLMQNGNETTTYMANNNALISRAPIEINPTLFNPNACSFQPDCIYWSFTSCTPDRIQLNGCDSAYKFERPKVSSKERVEWFQYDEY